MSTRNYNYYACPIDSELGQRIVALMQRMYEASKAASDIALEKHADELMEDNLYAAGGIQFLVYNHPPRAKKTLYVARKYEGQYYCIPNMHYNVGLRFAKKLARLPRVTFAEMYDALYLDMRDPQFANCMVPRYFSDGKEWVYICTDIDLLSLHIDKHLTLSNDKVYDAALKYAQDED